MRRCCIKERTTVYRMVVDMFVSLLGLIAKKGASRNSRRENQRQGYIGSPTPHRLTKTHARFVTQIKSLHYIQKAMAETTGPPSGYSLAELIPQPPPSVPLPLLGLGDNNVRLGRLGARLERLLKVGDDVVDVLRADRDADEVLRGAGRDLLLVGELAVGRSRGAVSRQRTTLITRKKKTGKRGEVGLTGWQASWSRPRSQGWR